MSKIIKLCTLLLISVSMTSHASFKTLENFGANPGELTASYLQPKKAKPIAVVLLHGCVQNGQQFASDSGFVALANERAFNLLVPQQSPSNNIQSCFNWFSSQDIERDQGELLSLKNMISAFAKQTQSSQVYIAGLSAGGAMTSALMYHYPNLFNGVAIVGGIPYPCADNLTKAISCMRLGPSQTPEQLANQITSNASTALNTLPRLSIWTGSADAVVNPKNANYLAMQWLGINKQALTSTTAKQSGYQKTSWKNDKDQVLLELVELDEIGHGMMINREQNRAEKAGDYLIPSPLSASKNIVEFWFNNQ
ncbi:PHB depolymerase family esterase [Thalassotalea sp. LPB0316]|uniref:extracellular catalytic domain type 1 short-chain-length polyhydroxyalkanoate depolymerase n=1 Tax=Thalassotalea sp. LPB0316 TaxID=2769490 RepID=UPI00186944E5|nr:PHB depolymerase family esterase [Thalassotalea sp. LPB0316]QOL26051.1 PHB depolymerase family esterase [Thalassotalea sp. LPB0316]